MNDHRQPVKVLDKGFVRLVDFMGGDQGIVDAARVSYGGVSKGASTAAAAACRSKGPTAASRSRADDDPGGRRITAGPV